MENFLGKNIVEEDTQAGRYLTFTIDENVYGIPIRFVVEIIGIQEITRVPGTPDFIKGIMNLRGKIIPLVEVRLKFGKEEIPYDERTCIIVVDMNGIAVGLIVDRVDDVLTIADDLIADSPVSGGTYENRFIDKIGQLDEKVQLLLDVERLLKTDEMDEVEKLCAEPQ
jgi:purine-binding chemotaxis protein CheW